jgi:hypothetical protein
MGILRMKRFLAVLLALCIAGPAFGQTVAQTTNASVTITTASVFQQVLASVLLTSSRRSLTIQNNQTSTDNCWIFLGAGTATKAASILLAPGQSYTRYYPYIPNDEIQATCATAADSLYVDFQ